MFVSIVTFRRVPGEPLTEEQLREIDEGSKAPITYDEDCPKLTEEVLRRFRRVNPREE